VIVPVYNEQELVAPAIAAIDRFLGEHFDDYEVVIVESGSTDRTGAACDAVAAQFSTVRVFHEGGRNGFGSAVRAGCGLASKNWVWPLVVDMPFRLEAMLDALPLMTTHDAVLSYRSRDPRGVYRRFQSALFNHASRLLLGVRVRHVNSAFKVVRTSVMRSLSLTQKGWLLDAELIVGLERKGIRYAEIPVELTPRQAGTSTIGPAAVARSVLDLLMLAARHR
jgi:glycosyltransferase involved in cell wall biosynthesis